MKYTCLGIICIVASIPMTAQSQAADSASQYSNFSQKISGKYINEVCTRSAELSVKLDRNTEVYLNKLKSQEELLQNRLAKIDSSATKRIFNNSAQEYDRIQNELKTNAQNILKGCGKYIPGIDTAITSLKFLQNTNLNSKIPGNISQIKTALGKVQGLEDQFKKSDNVEEFIQRRKEYLRQELASYNLGNGLAQYNKTAYYYAQQVNEYKEAWNDPTKMENKTLGLLEKIPAFEKFMAKNSMLAGLFNIPDDYASAPIAAGMQTRLAVDRLIQQQMTLIPGGAQTAQANILDAQSQLTDLRNKIQRLGSNSGGDMTMPDFDPNKEKTKAFLKRIEYGFNMQSSMAMSYYPSQTAFALTAGYKINDKNTVGVGISYNVGWGRDIQHIHISSQGIGFRSFVDLKIKGSFYGTGGFEYNYAYPFTSINQLRTSGLWQRSGLVGITKMVSLKSSLVKKTKLQLLWNFLSYSQTPPSQPIIFRIGYNF